jgi:hypothetical protein
MVDGVVRNTKQKNYRLGVTCAYPIKPSQAIVFNLSSGVIARAGPDFDTIAVAYQFAWGGG